MKKTKVNWYQSLSTTLIGWFMILSLIPMLVVTWQTYVSSATYLKQNTTTNLERTASSHVNFINNWFYYRKTDLINWSEDKSKLEFISKLERGFIESSLPLSEYVKSSEYMMIVKDYQNDFINLSRNYDYIYDIFMIDKSGNLLYSVEKESDLGTNLFSGTYSTTSFANMCRKTLSDGEIHFSDLERYKPSDNGIYSFISAPFVNEVGDTIGVISVQLKTNKMISRLSKEKDKIGFKYYIVGEDGLLRSSIDNPDDILRRRIDTENFKLWHTKEIKEHSIAHSSSIATYIGPDGKNVIGTHKNIDIFGIKWVLMNEVDEEVALAPSRDIALNSIIIVLIAIIVILIIVFFISRRITAPIEKLAKASEEIANSTNRDIVYVEAQNEIKLLADSFNEMVTQLGENEAILEERSVEAEEALRELSAQKLALDAHAIVAITDVRGTITYVNDKFVEISGYSKDELVGQNHRILNSGLFALEFWEEMYHTISSGNVWHAEIRNIAKDGHYYWVDTTIVPFLNSHGKPQSYIAIRADITEKVKINQELVLAKEQAEVGAQAKAEFLASMSHEIRTPMNGVLGMLGLLLNSKMSDTQRHQARIAQTSAQSLLTLINDILDFSKIEAGKIELENIEFNLRNELGDFAEAISFKAQEKGVEVILDLKGIERTIVVADPGRFRQIMTNLVGNAIKFTSDGEVVIGVSLKVKDDKSATIYASVKDSGIGIPKNKLDTLFDSFSQVDSSTTRKYGGTGLGLSIAKQLTELMGGEIDVKSVEGVGSTFSFTIDVGLTEHSMLVMPRVDVRGKNVLIVDDNSVNLEILREQLLHWSMNVIEASSAKEAMEVLKNSTVLFDIALIDMHMPNINGEELGKYIRSKKEYDDMKMVMMTSLGSRSDAKVYASIGFNGFFTKPTTTKDLFNALNILIEDSEALESSAPILTKDSLNMLEEDKNNVKWPENTRILLVEDNATNQLVALGILETFGLNADIANNGKEAISALRASYETNPYTIILMDCQMPVMDGYETSTAIRSGKAGDINTKIPIVAMTANAMKGDREKCIIAGMDDYLAKPINPNTLLEMLKKWLNLPSDVSDGNEDTEQEPKERELVIFDEKDLFSRLANKSSLVEKIIESFLDDIPKQFVKLRKSLDEENIEDSILHSHSIKGSSANISGLKLQDIAKKIEHLANDGDLDGAKSLFSEAEQACEELITVLENRHNGLENVNDSKIVFNRDNFMETLKVLREKLEQGTFIDTDDFELFKGSGNKDADKLLSQLKSKINSFEFDESLKIIEELAEV